MRKIISISIIYCLSVLAIYGQDYNLFLEVFSGAEPENIEWNLYNDATGLLLISDGGQITEPDQNYPLNLAANCSDCLRFEISGLGESGTYRIRIDSDWYVLDGEQSEFPQIHYLGNCSVGNSCDNAEEVLINSEFQTRFSEKEEHWYEIIVEEEAFLTLTACFNFTDTSILDTELWIYDDCPQNPADGPEGAIIYSDESFICLDGAYVEEFKLNVGTYIVRFKTNAELFEKKVKLVFIKVADRPGCTDPSSCNYNPFANVDDGSCVSDSECGPDLYINQDLLISSMYLEEYTVTDTCLYEEKCVLGFGTRELVRFSTEIGNIGNADFVVGDPIENSDGFSDDNCHDHWHQLGYASYEIYRGAGQPEIVGLKNGFCVLDISCDNGQLTKYNCQFMGISAGCLDIYNADIPCQWLDVTDLEDGIYTVIVKINWEKFPDARGMYELDYTNNIAQACIMIDRSSGETILSIVDDCPTYVDCFGLENGDSVIDCTGECGGLAHLGDTNSDHMLDSVDILNYFNRFRVNNLEDDDCLDLNKSSFIDIEDVLIVQKCLETDEEHTEEDHSHCESLETGLLQGNDTLYLSLESLNYEAESVDIYYSLTGQSSVKAISFGLVGADIVSYTSLVEQEYDYQTNNDFNVYLLQSQEIEQAEITNELFGTVFFNSILEQSLCLADDVIAFDQNFERLHVELSNDCILTDVAYTEIEKTSIDVYPNITKDVIHLNFKNQNSNLYSLTLLDAHGKQLLFDEYPKETYNLNALSNGCYFIIFQKKDSFERIVKRVVRI